MIDCIMIPTRYPSLNNRPRIHTDIPRDLLPDGTSKDLKGAGEVFHETNNDCIRKTLEIGMIETFKFFMMLLVVSQAFHLSVMLVVSPHLFGNTIGI